LAEPIGSKEVTQDRKMSRCHLPRVVPISGDRREERGRNVQRFRGGLVFKAHRLCVSLNSRLESNKEEEPSLKRKTKHQVAAQAAAGTRSAGAEKERFIVHVHPCAILIKPSDRLRVGWLNKFSRCSRDTYPESYITKYTSIRRKAQMVVWL